MVKFLNLICNNYKDVERLILTLGESYCKLEIIYCNVWNFVDSNKLLSFTLSKPVSIFIIK